MEKQARFWVLIVQGSTLTAACAAVGVNRRTGRRWRQATGGRIPLPEAERSGRYLCGVREPIRRQDCVANRPRRSMGPATRPPAPSWRTRRAC
ncbi:helix-turn-helix domain-containing protein [Cryobacterium sp. Hz9]|uniref:helix-turn-helix domain-containing protein n=1 Tax=Cryobacterium sp. Hz9 TaxID=1259167 RepID=UPI0035197A58